jgi:hypothetical protein
MERHELQPSVQNRAHRAIAFHIALVAKGCWLLEREKHCTIAFHKDRSTKRLAILQRFAIIYDDNGKRKDSREECNWSHARNRFKRTYVGSNGILECKFLSKNEHRAGR